MKCPKCDYSLWNITPGPCPECGQPFQPSDFDFKPGSVAFLCGSCQQDYYGSSRRGHLEPKAFECVSCHRPLDMDGMASRPADEFVGSSMIKQVMPWKASNGNPVKRWFLMTGASLGSPVLLSRGLPKLGALRIGFIFFIVNLIVFPTLYLLPLFLLMGLATRGTVVTGNPMGSLVFFGSWISIVVISSMVLVLILAVLSHMVLSLTGRIEAGLSRTVASLMVTSSPTCIVVVPCLGLYLAPFAVLWWWISFALALRGVHGVSTLRAGVSAFLPPFLLSSLGIGLLFVFNA